GGRDLAAAVARRGRSREVFGAVLDPLDRTPELAAYGGEQHDIGKHRLLDAEAAAAVGRRDQAQAIARDLERPGHQRLEHERTLEVRPHRETVGRLLELGDDAE